MQVERWRLKSNVFLKSSRSTGAAAVLRIDLPAQCGGNSSRNADRNDDGRSGSGNGSPQHHVHKSESRPWAILSLTWAHPRMDHGPWTLGCSKLNGWF